MLVFDKVFDIVVMCCVFVNVFRWWLCVVCDRFLVIIGLCGCMVYVIVLIVCVEMWCWLISVGIRFERFGLGGVLLVGMVFVVVWL